MALTRWRIMVPRAPETTVHYEVTDFINFLSTSVTVMLYKINNACFLISWVKWGIQKHVGSGQAEIFDRAFSPGYSGNRRRCQPSDAFLNHPLQVEHYYPTR